MKHRARKSKSQTSTANGLAENEENGQLSDAEVGNESGENPSADDRKRRSSNKRKSSSKNASSSYVEKSSDEEDQDSRKNKRGKRKTDQNDEESDEPQPEKKSRKSQAEKGGKKNKGKGKSGANKSIVTDDQDEDDSKKKSKKEVSKEIESEDEDEGDEDTPQYEVELVLDEKNIRGVKHYLIRWKGYEPESDTWEPEPTLNCAELISEFKKNKAKNKNKPKIGKPKKEKFKDFPDETWDENEDFEVQSILDVYFKKNGKREFLVLWKGYGKDQSSWEPEENMDCKDLIVRFMDKVEQARNVEERELRVAPKHTDRLTFNTRDSGRRLSKRNQQKGRVHYHDAE